MAGKKNSDAMVVMMMGCLTDDTFASKYKKKKTYVLPFNVCTMDLRPKRLFVVVGGGSGGRGADGCQPSKVEIPILDSLLSLCLS
jgi:hypothetical protein